MGRVFQSLLAAATILAAIVLPSAVRAETVELSPTSEWTFREYSDRCRASRKFGTGESATTLWVEQGGKEPRYTITFLGEPLRHPYGPAVRIRFGSDEKESIRSYVSAESSKGRPVLMLYGVTLSPGNVTVESDDSYFGIGEAREAAITSIHLRGAIADPLILETGSLADVLARLRECSTSLSYELQLASSPIGGLSKGPQAVGHDNWLPSGIYPDYLVRSGIGATLEVRLTVAPTGRPSNCVVLGATRSQLFDDALCLALMKRAKFEPALDSEGSPTASYYLTTVTFEAR